MYDSIRCLKELPWPEATDFGSEWQTKSIECQLDDYEIRADGTLWHQKYETEDRSDPNAEGLMKFAGMMTRVNLRWAQVPFVGELEMHHLMNLPDKPKVWYSVRFWFREGIVRDMICDKTERQA